MDNLVGNYNIGMSGNVAGGDALGLMSDLHSATAQLTEEADKTGVTFGRVHDNLKEITTTSLQLTNHTKLFNDITRDISAGMMTWHAQGLKVLDTQQQITKEVLTQSEQIEKISRQEKDRQAETRAQQVSEITRPLQNPGGAVGSMLPEMGAALAVGGAVASKLYGTLKGFQDIALAGGETTLGGAFGSAGNVSKFSMESKLNSMLGYASESESAAAVSNLMKLGGLRGDELVSSFNGMAVAARNAGIALSEYAVMSATIIRRYSSEGERGAHAFNEEDKTTKYYTEFAGNVAEKDSNNFNKKDFIISALQVVGEVAPYGGKKASLEDVFSSIMKPTGSSRGTSIMEEGQKAVNEGLITQKGFNDMLVENIKHGKSMTTSYLEFVELADKARTAGTTLTDLDRNRAQVSQQLSKITEDRGTADEYATKTSIEFSKGLDYGVYKLSTLSSILTDLYTKAGMGAEAVTARSQDLDIFGAHIRVAGDVLGHNSTQLADKFQALSKTDYATNFDEAVDVNIAFGVALRDNKIKFEDLSRVLVEGREIYGMSNDEAKAYGYGFIKMNEITHVATDKLMSWSNSITKDMITMFHDPKEAAIMAAAATATMAKQLDEGRMSVGDITKIMKMNMDVFGDNAVVAMGKVAKFADLVETSGIRMDEFTKYLDASTSVMKKYGVEEAEGTALFMGMNKYVREGTMSMQDFTEALKGPLGGNDAMQALLYSTLQTDTGVAGKAARAAGNPFGFILMQQDIVEAAGEGKNSEEAGKRLAKLGLGTTKSDFKYLLSEMKIASSENLRAMTDSLGSLGSYGQAGLEQRFLPATGINTVNARGSAQWAIQNNLRTGEVPTHVAPDPKDKDYATLIASYKTFDGSVASFSAAVNGYIEFTKQARAQMPAQPTYQGSKQGPETPKGKIK